MSTLAVVNNKTRFMVAIEFSSFPHPRDWPEPTPPAHLVIASRGHLSQARTTI